MEDTPDLQHYIDLARSTLQPDFGMGWNLLLALFPLALALVLFRRGRSAGLLWWIGLVVFVLFLPNSAYTPTDVIHLVHRIRQQPYIPVWRVSLLLIPEYALFMYAGLQAHTLSLLLFGDYLRSRGWRWFTIVPLELVMNLLVSLGIYFGRFQRFNSWDVIHDPERIGLAAIDDFTERYPQHAIAATFVVLCVLYYTTKLVDRALIEYFGSRRRTASLDTE